MGNACSCMRSSSSSSSLLRNLDLSAEFGNQICSDFTEGKIENVPYVGMAASLVGFALEHVHKTSADDELRLRRLQHMSTLVKRMNSVRDPHHREKFHDMILVILNITISIVNQIQSPSVSRVLFAHLDPADFQKLKRDLSDKLKELELDVQLSTLQNVPQIATPSIQSCSPTAVGIEDAIEEVKAKLKMGDKSRRVVAIFGMGGTGKTILATEAVNSLSSDIEAAYGFCRFDMDIKSTNIVQLLHNAFKRNEKVFSPNDSRTKLLQTIQRHVSASSPTSKPLFLFIGNALKEDEVRELLRIDRLSPLPLPSRILVSSRNLNEIQALMKMQEFESEALNVAENGKSEKIICHCALGNQDSAFLEDVEVKELLKICGGIPLVIQMAGMKLKLRGYGEMANSCRYITRSILKMRKEGWKGQHSDRMVDFVYGQLSKPLQTLFLVIAFFYLGNKREKVEYMTQHSSKS